MKISNQSNVTYNAVAPNKAGTPGSLASNTVNTEVLSYEISKVISCDKTMATEGETVHNTITITNNSETKLAYTFLSNPTPNGASYVAGSVKVNGVAQPDYNMINGFYLPDLNPGETLTVEYDMQINSPMTVSPVTDTSEFQYTATDPVRGEVFFSEYTNPISINVVSAGEGRNVDLYGYVYERGKYQHQRYLLYRQHSARHHFCGKIRTDQRSEYSRLPPGYRLPRGKFAARRQRDDELSSNDRLIEGGTLCEYPIS